MVGAGKEGEGGGDERGAEGGAVGGIFYYRAGMRVSILHM